MRKMAKGAAITGAVFCIVSLLFSLIGLLTNIANYSRMGHTEMIGNLLGTNIPALLVFVFLTIVLFRRKADTFAGVIFILLGVYGLINFVGNITAISTYQMVGLPLAPLFFSIVSNLLRAVLYILMAVHCFRKNGGKTPLYGIGFIVVGLVATAQTVIQFAANGMFDYNPGAAVITLIPTVIGGIIGALPLILTGFAVGNAKAATPVDPADPYGLYAKYGIQPQTSAYNSQNVVDSYQAQQSQYQAPQQNTWQQPQYQAPQQQTWQQPQYQAPQQQTWQQPQYQAPQQQTWQQPQYQAPQQNTWQQPQYQAPQQENELN